MNILKSSCDVRGYKNVKNKVAMQSSSDYLCKQRFRYKTNRCYQRPFFAPLYGAAVYTTNGPTFYIFSSW